MRANWLTAAVAAPLAGAVICAGLPAAAQDRQQHLPTMTMSGSGQVSARPDMATISSGVVSEAASAREALDRNNTAMRAVLDAVKAAGIEARDVATSGFSVQPRYVHPPQPKPGQSGELPRIVGYTVSNTLNVKVLNLTRLGEVLDKLVSVGANRISGIQFAIDEDEALLDEARGKAVKDAQRKARLYALAANVELGRIMSINETQVFAAQPAPLMRSAMAARDESVPIEAGEANLSVTVNVTWELLQ